VKLLRREDQARFLGQGGKLPGVVASTERILRSIGQLSGSVNPAGVVATVHEESHD
jgi:hypothetical protein